MDEWEKGRRYGVERLPALLKQYNYGDIRFQTIKAQGDWYLQTRSVQNLRSGSDSWDGPLVSEKDFTANHNEIWAILREKISRSHDLAQARPGDIFDSMGTNISLLSRQPSQSSRNTHDKRTPRSNEPSFSTIKEEEIDPGVFQNDSEEQIDLTGDSPRETSPLQETYSEFISPGSSNTIDLTLVEEIDLTRDEPPRASTVANVAPHILSPANEPLRSLDEKMREMQESDRDSLFDGTDSESDFSSVEGDPNEPQSFPLGQLSTLRMLRENQGIVTSLQRQTPINRKRGRKTALDIADETEKRASIRPESNLQRPRKRKRMLGPKAGPSLFTAVNGRVVVRERDGQYSKFIPQKSSGSALAKQRLEAPTEGSNPENDSANAASSGGGIVNACPDDLEDYEDVEENQLQILPEYAYSLLQLGISLTDSHRTSQAIPSTDSPWMGITRPNQPAVHHVVDVRNRPKLFDPTAPPLFLLRLSHEKTLRLMLRDVSQTRLVWYPVAEESVKPDPDAAISEDDLRWKGHELHLLLLAPHFHSLAWEESMAKQEELLARMNEAANSSRGAAMEVDLNFQLAKEQENFWRPGEREKAVAIPRVADLAKADQILSTVPIGGNPRLLNRVSVGEGRLHAGTWAQLVLYETRSERPSASDENDLIALIRWLDKQGKFLVLHSAVVDAHHQHPYTLIIFSSRRYGLGIAQLGRQIANLDQLPELDIGQGYRAAIS
ncbi:hypothetical protein FRC17_000023 [Serendipita sp. 399]|nr:hypothetical protein FRC17_000023 [Serendipita sp. 399]